MMETLNKGGDSNRNSCDVFENIVESDQPSWGKKGLSSDVRDAMLQNPPLAGSLSPVSNFLCFEAEPKFWPLNKVGWHAKSRWMDAPKQVSLELLMA